MEIAGYLLRYETFSTTFGKSFHRRTQLAAIEVVQTQSWLALWKCRLHIEDKIELIGQM